MYFPEIKKTFAVSSLVLNLLASQIGDFFLPHPVGTTCGRNYAFTHASFIFNVHDLLTIADGSEVGYVKDERWLVFNVLRTSHLTLMRGSL